MKIIDFLKAKLENFKKFINNQLELVDIPQENKDHLSVEITFYKQNITVFIPSIVKLANYDIDKAIKLFLLQYDINIDDIKEDIDYEKLKKYLTMFIDVVKNNIT